MSLQGILRLLGLRTAGWALQRCALPRPLELPPRILAIRPDHLGDLLFATPALQLLRRRYPDAHITAMVGPWGRPVIEHGPPVDDIILCDFPWFNRRPRASLIEPYALLVRQADSVRAANYDVVLNLRFDFWWGALLASLAGVPCRVGFDHPSCRPFLSHTAPHQPGRHEVEQNLRVIDALTDAIEPAEVGPKEPARLTFTTTPTEEAQANDLLAGLGIGPGDLVVAIHPGSGAICKLWTAQGFAQVADALIAGHGAKIILTGSPEEIGLAYDIASAAQGRLLILAGQTDLGQLAAIFRRCRLVIGVDSGAMHLAVATGTPTVHLFGPSDWIAFGPYGDRRRHRVVKAGYSCSPCERLVGQVRQSDCMKAIKVESVLQATHEVLAIENARQRID